MDVWKIYHSDFRSLRFWEGHFKHVQKYLNIKNKIAIETSFCNQVDWMNCRTRCCCCIIFQATTQREREQREMKLFRSERGAATCVHWKYSTRSSAQYLISIDIQTGLLEQIIIQISPVSLKCSKMLLSLICLFLRDESNGMGNG